MSEVTQNPDESLVPVAPEAVVVPPAPEVPSAPKVEAKADQPAKPWLERLKVEAAELRERNEVLAGFLANPALTAEVSELQRSLLRSQHTYQTLLLNVLDQRIEAA